jgi:hypothetical protein
MSLDERTLAVFDAFQSGRLSRRQFVKRLAALGFAGGTISMFLAACGGSTSPTATTAPTAAAQAATPTRAAVIPTPAPAITQAAPAATTAATTAAGTSTTGTTGTTGTAPAATTTASGAPGVFVSPDPNPKRGGTLRMAFGITTSNYDLQQGA